MGYLDNTTVTVDAILTNKGREVLATTGQLNITKFALSDDEVDYDLWNPSHTLGSNYYGAVIENMPLVEALPDESQLLRYKLITLPKDSTAIPYITPLSSISLTTANQKVVIAPTTSPTSVNDDDQAAGYTAIIANNLVAKVTATTLVAGAQAIDTNTVGVISNTGLSQQAVGLVFEITPIQLPITTGTRSTTITIIGNASGAITTATITNSVRLF